MSDHDPKGWVPGWFLGPFEFLYGSRVDVGQLLSRVHDMRESATPAGNARGDMTVLLNRMAGGDRDAEAHVFTALQPRLESIATQMLSRHRGQSLQTGDLVHELYFRVFGTHARDWESQRHFLCVCAKAMRRILIDRAKAKRRKKRHGGGERVPLDRIAFHQDFGWEMIELHDALAALEAELPDVGRIAELYLFGGYAPAEIARIEGLARRTIERKWSFARAFLARKLTE